MAIKLTKNDKTYSHHIRAHVNRRQYWWTAQFDVIGIVSLMSTAAVPMIYYGLFDHKNIQKYYYACVRRSPSFPITRLHTLENQRSHTQN